MEIAKLLSAKIIILWRALFCDFPPCMPTSCAIGKCSQLSVASSARHTKSSLSFFRQQRQRERAYAPSRPAYILEAAGLPWYILREPSFVWCVEARGGWPPLVYLSRASFGWCVAGRITNDRRDVTTRQIRKQLAIFLVTVRLESGLKT